MVLSLKNTARRQTTFNETGPTRLLLLQFLAFVTGCQKRCMWEMHQNGIRLGGFLLNCRSSLKITLAFLPTFHNCSTAIAVSYRGSALNYLRPLKWIWHFCLPSAVAPAKSGPIPVFSPVHYFSCIVQFLRWTQTPLHNVTSP